MTTPTPDPLVEKIALAISERRFCRHCEAASTCCFACEEVARAVLPIVRKAQAEAWEAGARATLISEGYFQTDHARILSANPHRGDTR